MKILCVWQVYLNQRCSAAIKRCTSTVSGMHLKDLATFSSGWKECAQQLILNWWEKQCSKMCFYCLFPQLSGHWWWSNRINQTPYKYSCLVWFSLLLSTKWVVFLEGSLFFRVYTRKSYAYGSEWHGSRALAEALVLSIDYFFLPSFWHVLTNIKQDDNGVCCGRPDTDQRLLMNCTDMATLYQKTGSWTAWL